MEFNTVLLVMSPFVFLVLVTGGAAVILRLPKTLGLIASAFVGSFVTCVVYVCAISPALQAIQVPLLGDLPVPIALIRPAGEIGGWLIALGLGAWLSVCIWIKLVRFSKQIEPYTVDEFMNYFFKD